jgi:transcriptional regulator with XRE-family HTH domain
MTAKGVGPLLKRWRAHRRYSQLDLAAAAQVSQRHLSFVETGRSQPSRELVIHLAEVLAVPLRERNALLTAAGFAPVYQERRLDDPDMSAIRHAMEFILERHDPYPAWVMDRHWNIVSSNDAAGRMMARLLDPSTAPVDNGLNAMRLTFHPDGLRRFIANWAEVGPHLLDRIRRDADAHPEDSTMRELVAEVQSYPGVAGELAALDPETAPALVIPVHVKVANFELRMFSTLTTIGAPLDITAQELIVETFFPADETTELTLRNLAVD